MSEQRYERIHAVCFNLYEVCLQGKQMHGGKKWNGGCL